jgi:ABC-type sugar transport system substrate-binding protein
MSAVLRRAARIAIALLLAGSSWLAGCDRPEEGGAAPGARGAGSGRITVAMLPKLVNIDYFDACERGARRAAEALGVTLIYDGPSRADGAEQNNFIDRWIRQKVDVICVAPNQPDSVRPFIAKAKRAGIKVVTWDTDAKDSERDLMVNQVDDRVLAHALIDDLARQMGAEGEWAIAIASLTASNLNNWRRLAEARAVERYPGLSLVATEVTQEDENIARQRVAALLNARPRLRGILALDSNSVPGAAAAVQEAGKVGQVAVVGNSTPNKMRKFVKEGVVECFFLWDPRALGALTVACAKALVDGTPLVPGGRLDGYDGTLTLSAEDPRMLILSPPVRFTRDNIDRYDFGI